MPFSTLAAFILEDTVAVVASWGINAGAEAGFIIRCGWYEGRKLSYLFDEECCDAGGFKDET